MADEYRIEKDSLGEMKVPADALYGPQTQRAVDNFPISGQRFGRRFIQAMGLIKKSAATTNAELGHLDAAIARAIESAAGEVAEGRWDDQFVLDIYQTGSGTSTNMNTNEVVAHRATELLEGEGAVHPNDHVNFGQSSNDTIPTAIHISSRVAIEEELLPALEHMHAALAEKATAFDGIVKSGRTHLMDATPVRLGQEFAGYAKQVEKGIERVRSAAAELNELALGGTATGTGINTDPEFSPRTIARIAEATGLPFVEAADHFEAQGAKDAAVNVAGALNTVATSFMKIADDIRWLGSGPTSGIYELRLPAIHGESHDGHRGREPGQFRVERDDACARTRPSRLDHTAGQHRARIHGPLRRRYRGERGASHGAAREEPLDCHRSEPVHRVRRGLRRCEGVGEAGRQRSRPRSGA
jgi:fumarate hydratase class II